ncbi:hypothetical protein D3C84_642980 [compost metagenome]
MQRAHRRELTEVVVKRRRTHLHPRREVVYAHGFGVVQFQPVDGLGDPVALAIDRNDLPQSGGLVAEQQPVVNLALDQRCQDGNRFGLIQQRQQARERFQQIRRCGADSRTDPDCSITRR